MAATPKDELIERIFLGVGLVMSVFLFYFLRVILKQVRSEPASERQKNDP
jgi:hypothetical protein